MLLMSVNGLMASLHLIYEKVSDKDVYLVLILPMKSIRMSRSSSPDIQSRCVIPRLYLGPKVRINAIYN